MNNREADQIKYLQVQIETMKEENTQVDEQITTLSEQCKEYQNQMEVCFFFVIENQISCFFLL